MQAQEPIPFILWRISMNTRHAAKEDMIRMAEMAWEQKKTNTKGSGTHTQWPEHHLLVPNQYRRGGLSIKRFRGCGLVVGRKWVYFEVHVEAFFGEKCLVGMTLRPKKANKGLGPLDAYHRDS